MHVTLDHITKKFDDFTAVQDFSARLEDGELIWAFRMRKIDPAEHALRYYSPVGRTHLL